MKNLQSKDLPFRTISQFYTPLAKQKSVESIKVFPKANRESIFTPSGNLPSIISYVSGLNEAKNLPRRIHNRQQYFSLPKQCHRHQHPIAQQCPQQGQQPSPQSNRNRLNTFLSNNTTSKSMLQMLTHKTTQQRKLQQQKGQFDFYKTLRKQEGSKQKRFRFYNTIQKSNYFLQKFKGDNSLHERRTNKYQNMVRRNIAAQSILQLLDRSKQQYKHRL